MKESIFNQLEKSGIPYAVCVSTIRFKGVSGFHATDYFLVGAIQDYPALKSYGFDAREIMNPITLELTGKLDGRHNKKACERSLKDHEIREFKELHERELVDGIPEKDKKYIKVCHTADGRVFELRKNSLKKHIENLTNGGK